MPPAPFASAPRGQWTGWSPTPTNDRYQAQLDFDSGRGFDTVNKVKASGGSIDAGGPALAEGMVLTTSGYELWGKTAGNLPNCCPFCRVNHGLPILLL